MCIRDRNGSAITTGIVKETIVVINEDESIEYVPDRAYSRVAKAPQSFWLEDILKAQNLAIEKGWTNEIDSCTLMRKMGYTMATICLLYTSRCV